MVRKVLYTFASRLSNILVTLGVSVIISNALGASGRGEQALILLGVTLVCLFTQVAGGSALVFLTPRYPGKQLLSAAYIWIVLSGIVGWAGLFTFSAIEVYAWHILAISIIHSIWSANAFYLLGKEKSNWFNALNFIYSASMLIYLSAVWMVGELSLMHYVISLYLGHAFALFISFFGLKGELEGGRTELSTLLKKFIHHGGFIQLANIAQLLKYRIHVYIILYYLGDTQLGIYSNALAIAEGVWIISRSIAIVQFGKVANEKDDAVSRKLTLDYTWVSIGLSMLAVAVLLLMPDSLFTWVFGKDFTGIHGILVYLSVAIVALAASNLFSHYFSGTGKNHINFIGSALGLVITAGLGYWLIPIRGLDGAAIATSIAFSATAVYQWLTFWLTKRSRSL